MVSASENVVGSGEVGGGSRRLYCDNAATSFPKPAEVLQAMVHYATEIGASAGRGGYAEAQASAAVLKTCRERLNTLFNGENPQHFIFALNCTDALNLAIKGILQPGDHAVTTWMDHNSVLRPYNALASEGGISYTHVAVDPVTCVVDPTEIRKAIRPNTKLIAVVHGSNVTGTVQPIREIGKIAREAGIPFLVDAAQTAGHVPIDVQADCVDLLAFPGHKGLMGPLGTGALYIRPGLEGTLRPLRHGGTGSVSEQDVQPEFMPDKFEAGSHNGIGLAGLSAGVEWILKRTVASLWQHDQMLCKAFMSGVEGVEGLQYFGPQGIRNRMGVFSVRVRGMEPGKLAEVLENEFGILTRAGLHCAPLAHTHLGTVGSGGTTRLSFGPFLNVPDIEYVANALSAVALREFAAA
ncbi:MAG TPA: aminotransferase class V-fold PLP-dependent enzyme [Phycisphaerae bacterium]|nr:aminotransferase class V-fold PLP-dependent enzyme [Phycisphaerae bacterium]